MYFGKIHEIDDDFVYLMYSMLHTLGIFDVSYGHPTE